MGYLEEFQAQINSRNLHKFLQLWEEYCTCDVVDVEELEYLLKLIKNSDFASNFSKLVENTLPLLDKIEDKEAYYSIFKLLIDLQTTNTPKLAEITLKLIEQKYPNDPKANERLKLVGLRAKDNFQGALSNYDLLAHMDKGKFVFHTGGWGTGEIMEISPVREQISIEFENVSGRKHVSFLNAFKTLIPLESSKFLARRFSDPDKLEKEAKEDPITIIKLLLNDLGPKNAAEIKDELCELVIPESDWTKWWQNARAKIKKDTLIENPSALKEPFKLRKEEITADEKLSKILKKPDDINKFIANSYTFIRDLPNVRKNMEAKNALKIKLLDLLNLPTLTKEQELQIYIFLENMFSHQLEGKTSQSLIRVLKNIPETLEKIDIQAFKKRVLSLVREHREDWSEVFLSVLSTPQQSLIRDYILKELNSKETKSVLKSYLEDLLHHPAKQPETYLWYFQKLVGKEDSDLPFQSKEDICKFFDGLLVLLNKIETKPEYKDLTKKVYNLIISKRFELVRNLIAGTSLDFLKEFLLLSSKCQTFTDHDLKILRSLAAVVNPSLAEPEKKDKKQSILWTTEEGYLKVQERIRHIGTVEMIENAREVEAARALGDLRENSEYKFACEKRSQLQGELKTLSDQLKKARIITKDDISKDEIGIGNIIDLQDPNGNTVTYTILGPWDADPEKHILSLQSKFAEAMVGAREGDMFEFRGEEFSIAKIKSFLE